MKKLLGHTFAAALLAGAGIAATTTPASAASWFKHISSNGDQAEVDDAPGDGAAAWYWIYNASNDGKPAVLQFRTWNGDYYSRTVGTNGAARAYEFDEDIWSFRLCKGDDPFTGCSGWYYLPS